MCASMWCRTPCVRLRSDEGRFAGRIAGQITRPAPRGLDRLLTQGKPSRDFGPGLMKAEHVTDPAGSEDAERAEREDEKGFEEFHLGGALGVASGKLRALSIPLGC